MTKFPPVNVMPNCTSLAFENLSIMAAASSKKRKVGDENRSFNDQWTLEYIFILKGDKPLCLICKDTVAVIKKSNIKRHFEAKHSENFNRRFPYGSDSRAEKIESLKAELHEQRNIMQRFTSIQRRTTEASLHVSNIIAKSMVPYSHADVVKECMTEAAAIMFPDKPDIVDKMRSLALSRNTCTRRVEDISEDLCRQLKTNLDGAGCYSLAIDESCDILDVAQMSVFVRSVSD